MPGRVLMSPTTIPASSVTVAQPSLKASAHTEKHFVTAVPENDISSLGMSRTKL